MWSRFTFYIEILYYDLYEYYGLFCKIVRILFIWNIFIKIFPAASDIKSLGDTSHLPWDDPFYDIARHQIVEVAGEMYKHQAWHHQLAFVLALNTFNLSLSLQVTITLAGRWSSLMPAVCHPNISWIIINFSCRHCYSCMIYFLYL